MRIRNIESIIPHRYPMILIDHVDEKNDSSAICSVQIKNDSFLCDGTKVPIYAGLEYIAQAIAAFAGLSTQTKNEEPSLGFLLGARNFKANRAYFYVGEILSVKINLNFFESGLGSFSGAIYIEDEEILTTNVSTFKPNSKQLIDLKESLK